MAKEVYKPCGKFSLATTGKTFDVKTYLPISVQNYRYIKYYNISTSKDYGILGVLVHDGTNYDLSNSTGTKIDMNLENAPVNVANLDNSFSNVSFDNLDKNDQITFICFHDDNFESNNRKHNILHFFQSNLPNYYDFPKPLLGQKPSLDNEGLESNKGIDSNKGIEAKAEPMIGNGGILTFTGSC